MDHLLHRQKSRCSYYRISPFVDFRGPHSWTIFCIAKSRVVVITEYPHSWIFGVPARGPYSASPKVALQLLPKIPIRRFSGSASRGQPSASPRIARQLWSKIPIRGFSRFPLGDTGCIVHSRDAVFRYPHSRISHPPGKVVPINLGTSVYLGPPSWAFCAKKS